MLATFRHRTIIGAAVLLLLLGAVPAARACVWGYRVYCTAPTTKFATRLELASYPTREECSNEARQQCQSTWHWCEYALRNQGKYLFDQNDLDWCRDARRVKSDRLEGFCRAEIIR
jgi:hypothetical protein